MVTTRSFLSGQFICEYVGEHISMSLAKRRESEYAAGTSAGCFMYYFKHKGERFW